MTEEIPEQPRNSGAPRQSQLRTAMYVLEWLRDEWEIGDTAPEHDVLNDAHYLVQIYEDSDTWGAVDE